MFLSPTKYVARVEGQLRQRLSRQEVQAMALFQPRSPVTPDMSTHQARKLGKHSIALAVTPDAVHAFELKDRGYTNVGEVRDELAVWPRAGLTVSTGRGSEVLQTGVDTNLRIGLNLLTLRTADGRSIQLAATGLSKTVNEMNARFVQALRASSG